MKRQALSKKTRFEVFKRDNFTCQYCGAKPDESLLVVDHMHPVKLGGTNDLINLIASCQPCNQGKSARPLNEVHPRPDADLMRLEVHQEIAELERFQTVEQAKTAAIDETIRLIQDHFTDITGMRWQPQDRQIRLMLAKYEPSIVKVAIDALAKKMNHLESQGEDPREMNWVPYVWGVCKKIAEKNSLEFSIGYCSTFFAWIVMRFEEDDSPLINEDFDFINDSRQSPFMKAWRESQHPNSAFDTLIISFLYAGQYFEPLAKEFVREVIDGRIDAPAFVSEWSEFAKWKQSSLESNRKLMEGRSAA